MDRAAWRRGRRRRGNIKPWRQHTKAIWIRRGSLILPSKQLITNLRQNLDIPTQLHHKGLEEAQPNEAATLAFTNPIKLNRVIKIKLQI